MSRACPVAANCRASTHCPFCIDGSEYRPIDRRVPFPAAAEARRRHAAARRAQRASPAARSGRRSVRKGRRAERDAVRLFGGERVPLSGQLDGHPNDTVLPNAWRTEVKARRDGFGWLTDRLVRQPVLAIHTPDGPSLVAMAGAVFQTGPDAVPDPLRTDPLAWPPAFCVTRRRVKQLWNWLTAEQADALLVKIDRQPWVVLMDLDHWRRWIFPHSTDSGTSESSASQGGASP